ncbi:MAG: glutaredoxin 3 [Deltaproteobacteria bacterium]|nr:glutaredoxin 3 [Deltaproteobacteria bacterium]
MSREVLIYTTPVCPYCVRAKALLTRKGVSFREIDISRDRDLEAEMIRLTKKMTVPQILVDGNPIGGCDELHELEHRGVLDELLQGG